MLSAGAFANGGDFDMERWYGMLNGIKTTAQEMNISDKTINDTLKMPMFIPDVIKSDRNQSEFTLTLTEYLNKTVNADRIKNGKKMRATYPTLLSHVDKKYGVPRNVILAFWGMESNYGVVKSKYKLTDSFFTLIYEGRREKFFKQQLLALMKSADKNKQNINNIYGSWAGAMGHFQFIPTTLEQYGADGNNDSKIDIINDISDAMFSAGNYLSQLGWMRNEPIVMPVLLPYNFDKSLLDGKTKRNLAEWKTLGVLNLNGTPLNVNVNENILTGLVVDFAVFDFDTTEPLYVKAYLTYPNFYRIKKWNNSNWYAIAISELANHFK